MTAIAVFLHEIPQEVGDFSVLIFGGLAKRQAILLNILTAAMAYVGALATLMLSKGIELFTVPLVAATAGAFLFIALSELLPEIVHKEKSGLKTALLAFTFVLAIFVVSRVAEFLGISH